MARTPAPTPETTTRPWLDTALAVEERVELLLSEMTLPEKAGLFFHSMAQMGAEGALAGPNVQFGLPSAEEAVVGKLMNHFSLYGGGAPRVFAEWHNRIQELARTTRLGIPVTISSDPRHAFTDNPATANAAGSFSQWPEPLGLGAIGDPELVRAFADIVRQEYLAVGIRVSLHPQLDLTTEPRWSRQSASLGEDPEATGVLGAALVRGLQGGEFGRDSVSAMIKHFPGGGPQKDGEDPHFPHGREQVYPGDGFDLHLAPFVTALDAGARQVMPYYGMPVGTSYEEVGFGFNRAIITGILRERLGFDGIVCTDWGLVNDSVMFGGILPARAWGAEHLTPRERMVKILDAGADQFGGETCPELLVDLVESGEVPEARLDVSARRLLREKFELGLFDDPFVDPDAAERIVGHPEFRAAGLAAQRASVAVLSTRDDVLPVRATRWYVEGIAADVVAEYGELVASPEEADVAVLRLPAPYEVRDDAFERHFHVGSLAFADETVDRIRRIAAVVPTVVDVFLDRPALLEPVIDAAHAVVATWGVSSRALLDVLTGRSPSRGRLPFDIPRSMEAVVASRSDLPFDTADPLFRFGHGLVVPAEPRETS